jgi:hypothetical protein
MHLSGEMLDMVAEYVAIFVLFFVPALLIYVVWMIHILREKVAHRRGHPQAAADMAQSSLAPTGTNPRRVLQRQARQFLTQLDLIAIRNDRLANRLTLHLALGGGFPPAAP